MHRITSKRDVVWEREGLVKEMDGVPVCGSALTAGEK